MRIVADKDILRVEDCFSALGAVETIGGRFINAAAVKHADVLIVRSITTVDETLLHGSRVRYVGSVTSGTDHVDLDYLGKNRIGFGAAPGSNARAVAEYVLSALFALRDQREFDLEKKTVAIIGCGHTGSQVQRFLQTIGLECRVNDPPLKDAGNNKYCDLNELFDADVITVHVPLTTAGKYPTRLLIDSEFLKRLRPDTVLINTSRGGVVEENALLAFLQRNPRAGAVLDVWEGEPFINTDLLARVLIGTPHIAGHTLDARLRAVAAVCRQACAFFGRNWDANSVTIPDTGVSEISIADRCTEMDAIQMSVLTSYDARADCGALRQIIGLGRERRGKFFDALRIQTRSRREFSATRVNLPGGSERLAGRLEQLGFCTTVGQ
jgi:erythronate-4-phosphate dehydrogenase